MNIFFLINRDFFIPEKSKVCYNELIMQVDYSKLWERYKEKGYKNKTDLISLAGVSTNIVAKLNKGEYISMDSLHKICMVMNCDIGDIVTFKEKITQ